jgi:uncharacterized protein (TIGR03382 family)
MKTSPFLCAALTTLLVTGAANATTKTFTADLNGGNEGPPVVTDGTGTAVLTIDDVAKTICGTITYSNLSGPPTMAHIHASDSGNVLQDLPHGASPMAVALTNVSADTFTAILASNAYVNIHTDANGDGEISGALAEGGTAQTCPTPTPDAGTPPAGNDAGGTAPPPASDAGNGAGTTRADAGTSDTTPAKKDDGGCSTSGPAQGTGLAAIVGMTVAVAALGRRRQKQRRAR